MIKLLHGDCLELMKNIPDNSIDLILTDPPYGTTACKWDSVIDFGLMWTELKRIRKERAAVALFGSEPFSSALRMSNIKEFKYDWIWNKKQGGNPLNAKRMPLKIFENISLFYKHNYYPQMRKGKMRKKGGLNKQPEQTGKVDISYSVYNDYYYPVGIIEFANCGNKNKTLHPTQKPVALMEYLIKTYTNEGETVLDFTMGSGSTGVACKNLNRNFIGIEQDETYFQIAKDRIHSHLVKEFNETK